MGQPTNVAPVVDAWPNRSVQLGTSAALDGTVSDDGRPTGAAVTVAWAKSAGPGTVPEKHYPTPEERDERFVMPLRPEVAISAILAAGPHPNGADKDAAEAEELAEK